MSSDRCRSNGCGRASLRLRSRPGRRAADADRVGRPPAVRVEPPGDARLIIVAGAVTPDGRRNRPGRSCARGPAGVRRADYRRRVPSRDLLAAHGAVEAWPVDPRARFVRVAQPGGRSAEFAGRWVTRSSFRRDSALPVHAEGEVPQPAPGRVRDRRSRRAVRRKDWAHRAAEAARSVGPAGAARSAARIRRRHSVAAAGAVGLKERGVD